MKKTIIYRTSQPVADEESRHLSGYPIVFGERSVLLPDWEHGAVYEEIDAGAITDDLIRQSDVVANINHDDNQMIGRSVNGDGSLSLSLDEHGVKMDIDAPQTVYGDIAYEGTRRGDFRGMSFAFWLDPDKDCTYTREEQDGKDVYVRHINNIRGLMDVSIVTHPAYPTTDVEARAALQKEIRAAFSAKEDKPAKNEERSAAMMADYDRISEFLNNK